MHDPALWAIWYLLLLMPPALIVGTLIYDRLERRRPARLRHRK